MCSCLWGGGRNEVKHGGSELMKNLSSRGRSRLCFQMCDGPVSPQRNRTIHAFQILFHARKALGGREGRQGSTTRHGVSQIYLGILDSQKAALAIHVLQEESSVNEHIRSDSVRRTFRKCNPVLV